VSRLSRRLSYRAGAGNSSAIAVDGVDEAEVLRVVAQRREDDGGVGRDEDLRGVRHDREPCETGDDLPAPLGPRNTVKGSRSTAKLCSDLNPSTSRRVIMPPEPTRART
jgi:hypothetical protein